MTRTELPDGGGTVVLEDASSPEAQLELDVIVDPEEGLAFGLYWGDGDRLLAVWAATSV
jgi:hypothetical protein